MDKWAGQVTEASTRVNLDDLEPGMVLAADAVHMNGRVLLNAGACLTEKHLRIFRAWGLTEAQINGSAGEQAAKQAIQNIDPEIVMQTELALRKSFTHMDMDFAPVAELFRVCVITHAKALDTGGTGESGD